MEGGNIDNIKVKMIRVVTDCPPKFEFQCHQEWDELDETADRGIRFCQKCQQKVYLCCDDKERDIHAQDGHCIAQDVRAYDYYRERTQIRLVGKPIRADKSNRPWWAFWKRG